MTLDDPNRTHEAPLSLRSTGPIRWASRRS